HEMAENGQRTGDHGQDENSENLDSFSRNPLICSLCHQLYEEPCLLACYHTFCARCLRDRIPDGKVCCPLCGYSFCYALGQALCGPCREDTHRARMFSQHDIIHMSKRSKEGLRKCGLHGEPYIMFSTAKKTLLCINCFRDTSIEARLHCIDLDTAYNQGCKKLERAVLSLRELQNSVRDGVILFRALLEELKRNMESEKSSINCLCQNLETEIHGVQEKLLHQVDNYSFCYALGQALCGPCREDTHRARMFSQHDIIHMSKRSKEGLRKCGLHGEPYIMFSTAKKTLLCINCFRDTSIEARLHCIDLDTAYNQGCKKLERAVLSLRELQNSVRDGVILFRALLEELKRNMESEKSSINCLCQNLETEIHGVQEKLLHQVDKEFERRNELFRSQLSSLGTLLPTIQDHLIMCTTFASSASKHEFLHLGYHLIDRLSALTHMSYPLRPCQSSQIKSNYKTELARCLEPLLFPKEMVSPAPPPPPPPPLGTGEGIQSPDGAENPQPSTLPQMGTGTQLPHRPPSAMRIYATVPPPRKSTGNTPQNLRMKVTEGSGPFAEHCKAYDVSFREMGTRFVQLKEQVQELHRDVTLRRCLTKQGRLEYILEECASLERHLGETCRDMEALRSVLNKMWDEELQRIRSEQELFQMQ
ncbi:unnamed protein product, partial [Darwinula stevensoni]